MMLRGAARAPDHNHNGNRSDGGADARDRNALTGPSDSVKRC